MDSLQKIEHLTPSENLIINSYLKDCKVNQLNEKDLRNNLIDIIAIIIWESGFNIPQKEQHILINYMIDEIKRDFRFLTLTEVKFAMQKGIRGSYGEVMGINVRMMYKWLDLYVKETRVGILKKLPIKNEKKEVTDDEKRAIRANWIENCISLYEKWKNNEGFSFVDVGNLFYEYILKLNIVQLTKNERKSIWESAKVAHKEFLSNRLRGNDLKMVLYKFNQGDESVVMDIKITARNLALMVLFKKIKASGLNLRDIIEENEKGDEKTPLKK